MSPGSARRAALRSGLEPPAKPVSAGDQNDLPATLRHSDGSDRHRNGSPPPLTSLRGRPRRPLFTPHEHPSRAQSPPEAGAAPNRPGAVTGWSPGRPSASGTRHRSACRVVRWRRSICRFPAQSGADHGVALRTAHRARRGSALPEFPRVAQAGDRAMNGDQLGYLFGRKIMVRDIAGDDSRDGRGNLYLVVSAAIFASLFGFDYTRRGDRCLKQTLLPLVVRLM